jgi:hypothetical protein
MICALCFDKNPEKKESSGFQRIQIPLLPRSPAASQQFPERSCPLSAWSLLSRHSRTLRLTAVNLISSQVAGAELNQQVLIKSGQQIFLLFSFFIGFL